LVSFEPPQPLRLIDGGFINLITPVEEFFVLTKYKGPKLDREEWRLAVGGLVNKPKEMMFKDLTKGFSQRTEAATLECVINKEGEDLVGTGLWTGISLSEVLEEVGVKDGAVEVLFSSLDGSKCSISMEEALKPQTLLVHQLNGRPLREDHGFPLRLVVPGSWGYAWMKWIRTIEVIGNKYTSGATRSGWSEMKNEMQLATKIMRPKDKEELRKGLNVVAGASWDGGRRIHKVEVSVDGGVTWEEAKLAWVPTTPFVWTVWTYVWKPEKEGEYSIMVKATNELGITEPVNRESLDEMGMSGVRKLHKVVVTVK